MASSSQLIQTIRQFMDIAMHLSMRERGHFAKATGLSMPQFCVLMQLHYRGVCGRINLTGKGEKPFRRKQIWNLSGRAPS